MNWLQLLTFARPKKVEDRIVIVSIPKAGTYLLSELLKEIGFIQTYMHMGMTWVDTFDPDRIDEGRRNPSNFRQPIPLEKALSRIPEKGFAVGHLMYSYDVVKLLSQFKLIFLKRDLRDCVVSYMRFLIETGRGAARSKDWYKEPDKRKQLALFMPRVGPWLFNEYYERLVGWNECSGVLAIRFEDLISGNWTVIQEILSYLGSPRQVTKDQLARVLAADTITKSSAPTRWQDYWSEDADAIFRKLRGNELNAELGYSLS